MVSVGDLEQTATQNWAPHWLVCRITQLALKKAAGNLTYSTVPWSIAAPCNEFAQFAEEICGTLKLRILEFPYVSICFHVGSGSNDRRVAYLEPRDGIIAPGTHCTSEEEFPALPCTECAEVRRPGGPTLRRLLHVVLNTLALRHGTKVTSQHHQI
jgi:hypothetical protein